MSSLCHSFLPDGYVRVAGTRNEGLLLAVLSLFSLRHPQDFKSTAINPEGEPCICVYMCVCQSQKKKKEKRPTREVKERHHYGVDPLHVVYRIYSQSMFSQSHQHITYYIYVLFIHKSLVNRPPHDVVCTKSTKTIGVRSSAVESTEKLCTWSISI